MGHRPIRWQLQWPSAQPSGPRKNGFALRRGCFFLHRLCSVAEDGDSGPAAFGAGVENQVVAAVQDGVHGFRGHGIDLGDGIGVYHAVHVREGDEIPGVQVFQAAEVAVVVVGGDDQVVPIGSPALAAGGEPEPVVVPLRHDRQLQPLGGDLQITDIAVAVEDGDGHLRGFGFYNLFFRLGFAGGLRRGGGLGLFPDFGLHALDQALGFLSGADILLTVVQEKEQC